MAFSKAAFDLDEVTCADEASELLWEHILKTTRMNESIAAIHKIFKQDCKAVFYDLNGDGKDEIIGTHYASRSSTSGLGIRLGLCNSTMYILQGSRGKYKELNQDLYFDPHKTVRILHDENDGYKSMRVSGCTNHESADFVYNKNLGKYIDKDGINDIDKKMFATKKDLLKLGKRKIR